MHPSRLLLSLACAALGACATPNPAPPAAAAPATLQQASVDRRFAAFLDDAFDAMAALQPETLTALGSKQGYDRLNDYSEAGAQREQALRETQLERMKREFDYARLNEASQLSYRLFEDAVLQSRRQFAWRMHVYPVTNSANPATMLPAFLINTHRIDSVADARAYVARLRDTERVMRELSTQLAQQAARGVVPPQFVFAPVQSDTRMVIAGAPFDGGADSVLLADFKRKVAALPESEAVKAGLVGEAEEALLGPFRRGYEHLLATLGAVAAQARGNHGVWSLPDGERFYADRLQFFTTTDLAPDRIHATGLAEVARIQREMEAVKARLGFTGSLQEFFAQVKAGAQFHYPATAEGRQAYLDDARAMVAQSLAAAPRVFHRLPKATVEVKAVEPWRQETASVAFYEPPAPDGSRPGIYYVNLADMGQVLKPQIEGITYHEAVPGHHFQIAFAQEIAGMPKFRRFGFYGAYVEGWGLYAEKLAKELGFYRDPVAEFGRLSLELWRAARLVVDSGMHARRWTREQAIDYFRHNTMLSERDIVKEVERYLVWPGQATSYKIGELKILALRARAQEALGGRFDLRDFHEVVLGSGALPLDVLEQRVDAYIAAKQ